MAGKGHVGTSLGGMEFSPDRKKRNAARRERQEERWVKRSGPVVVKRIGEDADGPATQTEQQADEGADANPDEQLRHGGA